MDPGKMDLTMMTKDRLAIAMEQVEVAAKELGCTPLAAVAGFEKGNSTQREIYNAVKAKHPQENPDAST